MHSALLFRAASLIVSSFLSPAIGLRIPVDEVYRRDLFVARREVERELWKKDLICYEDDVLLSFQEYSDDSIPFCSSYLGIPELTSTSSVTAKTINIYFTTVIEEKQGAVATVPSTTVSITETAGQILRKRQQTTAAPIATASSIISECVSGLNLTVIIQASSACSCLLITTSVQEVIATTTSTLTETAIDYKDVTITSTSTDGVTTVTYTVLPIPTSAVSSALIPSSSGTYNASSVYISGTIPVPPGPTASGQPRSIPGVTTAGPTNSTTAGPSALSGSPTVSSNFTSVGPTSSAATSLSGCPVGNGTTFTTQKQTFKVLCGINYKGPSDQGLIVPSLYSCIDDCAAVNVGFSQNRCWAATYAPSAALGSSDCFFRSLNATEQPLYDSTVISAILITLPPTNNTNTTSSVVPTYTANSTYAPGNITSPPSSLFPSIAPTFSANSSVTSDPSKFPIVSTNSSSFSITPFTLTPPSKNRTYSIMPTASSNSSVFMPTASYNSSTLGPTASFNSSAWCHTRTVTMTMTQDVELVTVTFTTTETTTLLSTSVMTSDLPVVT